MTQIKASATSIINTSPQKVYDLLADYQGFHPKILPEQHFSDFKVVQGGIGAGTIIEFKTHVLGQSRPVRAKITVPEPGHLLPEEDMESGMITTFIIEPTSNKQKTSVTIETKYAKSGAMGLIERFTVPPLLRRIYRKELHLLEKYA